MNSKCMICIKTIAKNHRFIHCQTCKAKVHIKCNKTDALTFNRIVEENLPQFCLNCKPSSKHCGICSKTIAVNHKKLHCKKCNYKVHIGCNETDIKTYDKIVHDNVSIVCIKCEPNNIPFMNLNDPEFLTVTNTDSPTSIERKTCAICTKTIAKNHRNIKCDLCSLHTHINCNHMDVESHNKIINLNLPQVCIRCNQNDTPTPSPAKAKIKCIICTKTIAKTHRNLKCHVCEGNVHITCNKIDAKTYNSLKKENSTIFCINCQTENIPFQNLTDLQFCATNKGLNTDTDGLQEASITSTSLRSFFKEINKSNPFEHFDKDDDEDDSSLINCKYVDLNTFNYKPKKTCFHSFIPT